MESASWLLNSNTSSQPSIIYSGSQAAIISRHCNHTTSKVSLKSRAIFNKSLEYSEISEGCESNELSKSESIITSKANSRWQNEAIIWQSREETKSPLILNRTSKSVTTGVIARYSMMRFPGRDSVDRYLHSCPTLSAAEHRFLCKASVSVKNTRLLWD